MPSVELLDSLDAAQTKKPGGFVAVLDSLDEPPSLLTRISRAFGGGPAAAEAPPEPDFQAVEGPIYAPASRAPSVPSQAAVLRTRPGEAISERSAFAAPSPGPAPSTPVPAGAQPGVLLDPRPGLPSLLDPLSVATIEAHAEPPAEGVRLGPQPLTEEEGRRLSLAMGGREPIGGVPKLPLTEEEGRREALRGARLEPLGERRPEPILRRLLPPSEQIDAAQRETAVPGILARRRPSVFREPMEAPSVAEQFVAGGAEGASLGLLPLLLEAGGFPPLQEPETAGQRVAKGAGHLAGFIGGPAGRTGAGVGRAVEALLAPRAEEAFGRLLVKHLATETANLSTAMTMVSTGETLEADSPQAAALTALRAARDGALLGLAFGTVRGLFPGTTPLQTAARVGVGLAAVDAAMGKQPLDDRDLTEKAFDYSLNVYFLFRGAPLFQRRRIIQRIEEAARRQDTQPEEVLRLAIETAQERMAELPPEQRRPQMREQILEALGEIEGRAPTAIEAGLERRGLTRLGPEEPRLAPAEPVVGPEEAARRLEAAKEQGKVPEGRPSPILEPSGRPAPVEERLPTQLERAAERAGVVLKPRLPEVPTEAERFRPEEFARRTKAEAAAPEGAEPLPARATTPEVRTPQTFREYVQSQGKKWPIFVSDPDYLRLRDEYEGMMRPRYEQRGAQVVDRRSGQAVVEAGNGAQAQMEANRLNTGALTAAAGRMPAPTVKPETRPRFFPSGSRLGKQANKVARSIERASEEASKRFHEEQARREQERKLAPKPVVAPPPPVLVGKEQEIRVPAGRKYQIRYEVVEAGDLIPSHDPRTFAPDPRYPEGVQNRPYHSDPAEQAKVIRQGQDFEPLFMVSPQPSSGGTPIVASGANFVLSGNSRTMSLLRLRGTPDFARYVQAVKDMAPALGIKPEDVARAKEPVLIRRLIGQPDDPDFYRRFAKESNESFKQTLSTEAAAVSQGRALSPQTLDFVAAGLDRLGPEATLREFLRAGQDREMIRRLVQDGVFTDREINRFVDVRSGLLNEDGKRLVERAILGSAVPDPDLLQVAPDSALDKIGRSLGAIAKIRARGDEWDVSRPLAEALRLLTEVRASRSGTVEEFLRQQTLVEREPMEPRTTQLARALEGMRPTDFRRAMDAYAADAARDVAGQGTLGFVQARTPAQAFSEAFGAVPVGAAEARASYGIPRAERVSGEAGGAAATEEIQVPSRVQPEGPQVSVQSIRPSETTRETRPSTIEGPITTVGGIHPTSGNRIYQGYREVNAIQREATAQQDGLRTLIREATGEEPAEIRIKNQASVNRKLAIPREPSEISDYLAARIVAERPEDMARLADALKATGKVLYDDDFLEQPNLGYRARHLQVELRNGLSAEVQIIPRAIFEVQARQHQNYKLLQRAEMPTEERVRITDAMLADYEAAWKTWRPGVFGRIRQDLREAGGPSPEDFDLPPADLSRGPAGGLLGAAREVAARVRQMAFGEERAPFEGRPEYAVREGVNKQEAQTLAQEALADLQRVGQLDLFASAGALAPRESATGRGREEAGGVRTLALGIRADLVKQGRVDLRGRMVKSDRDLAELAQVYRDPRYETFRIFYVDDAGAILAHEGITSRLPGSASAFVTRGGRETNLARTFHEMQRRMDRLGATGYWLLHNHPSGDPKPSKPDVTLTRTFDEIMPGFRGGIVIDSGKYAHLSKNKMGLLISIKDLPKGGPDRLLQPDVAHDLLNQPLTNADQVADVGRAIKSGPDFVTVFYRQATGSVRAIQEIPRALFLRPEGADYIRGRQRAFGGSEVLVYDSVSDRASEVRGNRLVQDGTLLDYVWQGGRSAVKEGVAPAPFGTTEAARFWRAKDRPRGIRVEEEKPPYGEEKKRPGLVDEFGRPMRPSESRVERAETVGQPPPPPAGPEVREAPPEAPPPLEEPVLRLRRHREVLNAALEAMRRQGIERDERNFPILSDQILDLMREGRMDVPSLEVALQKQGLSLVEFGESLFRPSIKNAAQRLAYLSVLQKQLQNLAGKAPTKEAARTLLEWAEEVHRLRREASTEPSLRALSWWRRADNIRRGLLTGQLATAVRNFEVTQGRLPLDALDQALQRVMGGQNADPWAPLQAAAQAWSQIRPTKGGAEARRASQEQIDRFLQAFPKQWDRLFGSYSSDITRTAREQGASLSGPDKVLRGGEKVVELANFFNRFQEFAVRRPVFWAEVESRLKRRGIEIDSLIKGERKLAETELDALEADVRAGVDKALDITFAQQPAYGTVGWHFVRLVNSLPVVLSGPIPFPRFMVQSLRFMWDFSPLPILSGQIFTPTELTKIRAGDMRTLSRAVLGTAMVVAAWLVREGQDDSNRWYEVDAPGVGTVDIRPFNPFATYLFVGELAKRTRQGTLYKIQPEDVIRGIASANVKAGLGFFAADKIVQGLSQIAKPGKIKETLQAAGGELLSGLAVSLRTLTDLYAQFDPEWQIVRERRAEPLFGPLKAQFGVGEPLYLPTRAAPLKREAPALRQATGLTVVSEKNAAEKELDRLQFQRNEILPSTGNPEADNLIAKHMGPLTEVRLVPFVESERYRRMTDAEKMDALAKRLRPIRMIARARARAEDRQLFREVKEERVPGRRRLLLEERARRRQEAITEQGLRETEEVIE